MEEQSSYKTTTTNMEGTTTTTTTTTEQGRSTTSGVKVANRKTVSCSDFILRILALATTMIAVIVMAVAKETKTVPVAILPNLPPINVDARAKWQYLSAFVFFMVVNIIACIYAAISLILSIGNRFRSKVLDLMVIILDLIMVALLFSGNGAAAAIGVLAYKGNSHTQWKKVCNVFGGFCRHAAASSALSLIGSLMFILLLVLATSRLNKRSH
ncbi:Uncharacterized protein family UPF0497 [Macleaya cordata]|uniref:CASP-like protein n=1 Tax=Macleaya cordata TaxID=56857 RepID=A0A200Q1L1_MACCD|nr:Uncharacterized protein family UPF0497 [Macleaya cordata]